MKKVVSILLICIFALSLTGCNAIQNAVQDAMDESRDSGYNIRENSTHPEELVGTWIWNDAPYYIFNADGTGYMLTTPLFWGVNADGRLIFCTTIGMCGDFCTRPSSRSFTLDGDDLALRGWFITYNYTRQR